MNATEREESIERFVACLKIPTVSGDGPDNGSYNAMAEWLLSELSAAGASVECQTLPESVVNKPIVVAKIAGTDASLAGTALLFNCHYDVVPVVAADWTVPAFEGVRKEGKVFGRGAQDMKCVVAQYLTAIRKLCTLNFSPKRTIVFSFVPDEEIGGAQGMCIFLESAYFRSLGHISLAIDEGLASEDDSFALFYGERLPWWIKYTSRGNTGHASRFIEGCAVESIVKVCNKALAFREAQRDLLHGEGKHAGCSHAVAAKKKMLGDVTSLNITMLRAGMSAGGKDVLNVVPAVAEMACDIRISPLQPPSEVESMLHSWASEVNGQQEQCITCFEFVNEPLHEHAVTSTDPEENRWYKLFEDTLSKEFPGTTLIPSVFPAATDSRFLRAMG